MPIGLRWFATASRIRSNRSGARTGRSGRSTARPSATTARISTLARRCCSLGEAGSSLTMIVRFCSCGFLPVIQRTIAHGTWKIAIPRFIPWHTQAYRVVWELTRESDLVEAVFAMNDWLLGRSAPMGIKALPPRLSGPVLRPEPALWPPTRFIHGGLPGRTCRRIRARPNHRRP